MAAAGLGGAPESPLNTRIGPHRRFAWVESDLERFKAVKNALGGTINDVVLTVGHRRPARPPRCAAAATPQGRSSRRWCRSRSAPRTSAARSATRWPRSTRRCRSASPTRSSASAPSTRRSATSRSPAQAIGAERLTQLAGFAAPTVLNQAARLQARQRLFNLTVTNVPGPQFPLYVLGRRLTAFYPMVPLVLNTALGIAIMSYDGRLFFGLLGDYDAMADLDDARRRPARGDRRAVGRRGRAAERRAARRPGARPASRRTKSRGLRALGLVAAGVLVAVARPDRARAGLQRARRPRGGGRARPGPASCSTTAAPATTPRRSVTDELADQRPAPARRSSRATAAELSDDQILHALELGNVVILYDAPDPGSAARAPPGRGRGPVRRRARRRRPGRDPRPPRRAPGRPRRSPGGASDQPGDPADPALREFAEAWLGRGLGQ